MRLVLMAVATAAPVAVLFPAAAAVPVVAAVAPTECRRTHF